MQGIERIIIVNNEISANNAFAKCLKISQEAAPATSRIYRSLLPLMDGEIDTTVDKESVKGRYDHQEGIDVILTLIDGTRLTLQEKVLTKGFRTVTFEEKNGFNNAEGAWYKCTAQLYFCCDVDLQYQIESYCLIDMLQLRIHSVNGGLPWKFNVGHNRANEFRYLKYDEIPNECIIKCHNP